jgi:hypothetical protein
MPYSYYLERMAKHWNALVLNNYEAIMPLTWNKKYGLFYLYQPAFTPSLGVFGASVTQEITEAFIQAIPKKYRLVEISLNHGNLIKGLGMRNNYILSLRPAYEEIYDNYRENVRRNIKKAKQLGCQLSREVALDDILRLARPVLERTTKIREDEFNRFREIFLYLNSENKASNYGVYSSTNELVASCVYFFSHGRAYYILVGNHPNGKTMGASHFLIDAFIQDHAGRELLLDFEGSDIPSLSFFYSSFGAVLETYPFLSINRLPFWARIFR